MTIRSLAACALLATLAAAPAWAEAAPRTITVSGQGEARAAPDEAQFTTGVVSLGDTAAAALAANSRAMHAVFDTLRDLDIPDKDIQTSNFSLMPRYQPCKPDVDCPQKIIGYQVSNTVGVTVEDMRKTGKVLDALVSSGSNQIGGISFAIRDTAPLLKEAREAAVKDAVERARTYAKAAGVKLGAIQSIQEGFAEPPRPVYRGMAMMAAAPPPPIAGGEESVSANVTITWLLQ